MILTTNSSKIMDVSLHKNMTVNTSPKMNPPFESVASTKLRVITRGEY